MPALRTEPLARVSRIRGVRGVILTTLGDAIPIQSLTHVDVDVDALAAFATSMFRRARQTSRGAGFGAARVLTLDATDARIVAAARDDLLLVALADRATPPGMLRMSLLRALEEIA